MYKEIRKYAILKCNCDDKVWNIMNQITINPKASQVSHPTTIIHMEIWRRTEMLVDAYAFETWGWTSSSPSPGPAPVQRGAESAMRDNLSQTTTVSYPLLQWAYSGSIPPIVRCNIQEFNFEIW